MDLQNLAPSDGLWKLIAFVAPSVDLAPFAALLERENWKKFEERVTVNVVLDAKAENAHWTELPEALRKWQRSASYHQPILSRR
jgi:hypothetical protein